jgi:hypothetical protein
MGFVQSGDEKYGLADADLLMVVLLVLMGTEVEEVH